MRNCMYAVLIVLHYFNHKKQFCRLGLVRKPLSQTGLTAEGAVLTGTHISDSLFILLNPISVVIPPRMQRGRNYSARK